MRNLPVRPGCLALAIALGCAGAAARGDFLTPSQAVVIDWTPTDWGPGTISPTTGKPLPTMTFNKFDATPGDGSRLTGVVITMNYQFLSNIALNVITASSNSITSWGSMLLTRPDGTSLVEVKPTILNTATFNVTANDILPDGTHEFYPGAIVHGSLSVMLTDPADLALFSGPGTITLPVGSSATSNFGASSGNADSDVRTISSVSIIVTYLYVPEPSAFALTGLGAAGLLVVRGLRTRNRRRQGSRGRSR